MNSTNDNFREHLLKQTKSGSRPWISNIELISICNLQCRICIDKPLRQKRVMQLEQVVKIAEKNRDLLVGQRIWLHHFGEPLLHPQLTEIIRYLSNLGVLPRLSTNATLLHSEISRNLMEAGLDEIVFSIDGANRQTYEGIRIGAKFETVRNNVLEFLNIKSKLKKNKPTTQVQLVNVSNSDSEINDFIQYWAKTSVDWINIKTLSSRALRIKDDSLRDEIAYRNSRANAVTRRNPCYFLWSTLIILSDGKVVPCCADLMGEIVLGNAFDDSLLDIWNGLTISSIRNEHLLGDYRMASVCRDCPDAESGPSQNTDSPKDEACVEYIGNKSPSHLKRHRLIKNSPSLD